MRKPKWYVDNKLKPPKAFWTWCYSQIPIYRWSNKEQEIISSDRQGEIINKRLTKRSKLTMASKFKSMAIILVTSKRIEIQSYGFWVSYHNGKEKIEFEMTNLERFSDDAHVKIGCWFGRYGNGLVNNYGIMGGPYEGTVFFDNRWFDKIQRVSELRYLDFYDEAIERFHIAQLYKYRTEIEYLQKINSHSLAKEIMFPYLGNVDMRTINKNWLKKNKPYLKNKDINFRQFELEQRIKERKGKVVPGIERYLDYQHVKKIPKDIGIVRFQNWVIKNQIDIRYYFDYLDVLKDLGVPIDSENVIIPTDLTVAHDNAVRLLNQMEREVEEKRYNKRLKVIWKLEREYDDYLVKAPKSIMDLITEGKILHHCVGGSGYVEKHRKGKTTILFIRHKNDADTPFYTMEYRDGSIIQIRGAHNIDAPKVVKDVADRWLQEVNK